MESPAFSGLSSSLSLNFFGAEPESEFSNQVQYHVNSRFSGNPKLTSPHLTRLYNNIS